MLRKVNDHKNDKNGKIKDQIKFTIQQNITKLQRKKLILLLIKTLKHN